MAATTNTAATATAAAANESKLINQGSYGCIYYPSLPFQLSRDNKAKKHRHPADAHAHANETRGKYVSKLQKHNFHSEFEDYIGKKIQEIPSFELFFVPILKTHRIDLATIKQSYLTDCDAISKYMKRRGERDGGITTKDYDILNKKFIIQKMKYIKGIYLHHYILGVVNAAAHPHHDDDDHDDHDDHDSEASDDSDDGEASTVYVSKSLRKDERQVEKYRAQFKEDEQDTSSFHLMSVLFDLYERINDSIQILIKYNIVHYDLKENNILVEHTQQLPYIIDFGLSIDISRLLEHPWSDKQEERASGSAASAAAADTTIDSDVLYRTNSSKIFQHNYLWRQHFYVHAPDYFLWPIEVHLMTYLINEQDTLTEESLRRICYTYIRNNKALVYVSREFKKKLFRLSVATFSRFIHQPREKVLNELLKYWAKWDMYAINVMFIKIVYEMVFHKQKIHDDSQDHDHDHDDDPEESRNEQRQKIFDPEYSSDANIVFKNHFKIKLKQKYNNEKIMNTIQIMLRNIHPNPDKRMTPQETKAFFVSIFYEC
jgi:serine/threonine protein kinase